MPIRDLENHEHAEISLKIVVIGGSIAGEQRALSQIKIHAQFLQPGLAAAYALKRAGHDVRVVEQSNGESTVRYFRGYTRERD